MLLKDRRFGTAERCEMSKLQGADNRPPYKRVHFT